MFKVDSAPEKEEADRRRQESAPPTSVPPKNLFRRRCHGSSGLATDFYPSFRKFTTGRVDNVFDFDSADASGPLMLVNFDALLRSRLICKVVSFSADARIYLGIGKRPLESLGFDFHDDAYDALRLSRS